MEVYCVALYLSFATVAHGHIDLITHIDNTMPPPWNSFEEEGATTCKAPFLKLTTDEWKEFDNGQRARLVNGWVELERVCGGTVAVDTMTVARSGPFDDMPAGSLKVVGMGKRFGAVAAVPMAKCGL
jgi:hypothetical protein